MNLQSEYFLPVALSIVLHVLVGMLLFVSWDNSPLVLPTPPKYVQAVIIEKPKVDKKKIEKKRLEALKKKRQEREARAKKERQKREAKLKKEQDALVLKKKREEKKRKEEEKKRKEKEQKEKERKEKEQKEKERKEKLRREEEELKRQELLEETEMLRQMEAQEQLEQQNKADQSVIDKYRLPIKQKIEQYWSRPPSARRGMRATLDIRLIPGGEVVSVTLVKSSGNAAFDQSAVTAVQRAKTLPTPSDPRVFDRHFRTITLVFDPKDLLK